MLLSSALLAGLLATAAQAKHGDGALGSIMGPVAFLWPDDRPWSADQDNNGPCGSAQGVVNRTKFPLKHGSVETTVADAAYQVAFYIAYDNTITAQSQFQAQVVDNVTEVIPGHQCYPIRDIPDTVTPGTNATIQMAYWAAYKGENDGKNETFYACADITFVDPKDFTFQAPCFNVTVKDFDNTPTGLPTTSSASATATETSSSTGTAAATSEPAAATSSAAGHAHHLSGGAKAGIAVGTIVGGLALIAAAVALVLYRRRRQAGYLERRQASRVQDQLHVDKEAAGGMH